MNQRIEWDELFIELCKSAAKRSADPKTQVGAVIVNLDTKTILSLGYNGITIGMENTKEVWSDEIKDRFVVHAESNALLNILRSGNTIDINKDVALFCTHRPCNECSKLIAQSGIKKVFYINDKNNKGLNVHSDIIFQFANVEAKQINI